MRSVLLAFALAAGCSAPAPAPGKPVAGLSGFRADPAWPKRPAAITWGDMPGVAVDREDRVWIFTRQTPAVQVYAPDGELVRAWSELPHKMSHHVKIDPEGNVWLADVGFHTVSKYTPEGRLLLRLGTPDQAGEDETRFNKPTDMAITPAGDVYVSDGYGNNRIVRFTKEGRFVKAWGKKGPAPGDFDLPHAIGVDSKGRLYVADRNNARVQVFDPEGKFLTEWRNVLVPWGIWVTAQDEVWVCGSSPTLAANDQGMTGIPPHDQVLVRFDAGGRVLQVWSPPKGDAPGELNWVHALAADSKGNLYCGDIRGRRVQKFVPLTTP
jgi:DNA-binding beta-propeller fold protein YncE